MLFQDYGERGLYNIDIFDGLKNIQADYLRICGLLKTWMHVTEPVAIKEVK